MYRMIVFSDNNATALLQGSISPPILDRTYAELRIPHPYVRSTEYTMSVEACAGFFRILFNASYLNKEMSEKALRYLAVSDFRDGIVAGVPPQVAVAHKFGERELGEAREIKELHDCGIIYYPNHPYLLCIMTSGSSFQNLDDAISGISRLIYQEIDGQHRSG